MDIACSLAFDGTGSRLAVLCSDVNFVFVSELKMHVKHDVER